MSHKNVVFADSLLVAFLQVKDSPCLAGTPASDAAEKENEK